MESEEPKEREVPSGAEGKQAGAGEGNSLVQFMRSMRDFKGGIAALKAVADSLKSAKPAASNTSSVTNVTNSMTSNVANSTALTKEIIAAKERETAVQLKTLSNMPAVSPQGKTAEPPVATKDSNALQKSDLVNLEKDVPKGAGEQIAKSSAPHPVAALAQQQLVRGDVSTPQPRDQPGPPAAATGRKVDPALLEALEDRDFNGQAPIMKPENATSGERSFRDKLPLGSNGKPIQTAAALEQYMRSEFAAGSSPTKVPEKRHWTDDTSFPEADIPELTATDRASRTQSDMPGHSNSAPVSPAERLGMSEREIPVASATSVPRATPSPPNRSGRSDSHKPPMADSPIPAEWYVPGREAAPRAKTELPDSPIPEEWAKPMDKRAEPTKDHSIESGHTSTSRDFPDRDVPTRLEASARTNAPEAGSIGGDKKSGSQKEVKLTGELTLVSMNSEVIGRARANMNGSV